MVYQALTDDLISIGPPYFNAIFVPLMALLALVLGVGPISRWKKTSGRYLSTQLLWVGVISLGLGIALPLMITLEFGFGPTITIALALWILLSAVRDIKNKVANKKTLSAGLASLPLSYYGMQLAHLGVATMIVGAALTSVYSTEKSVLLSPGERMNLGGYAFEFVGAKPITGPNFRGMEATLEVYRGEEFLRELHPERRLYLASGTPSTEMAIDAGFWRDLFVTLGEEKGAAAWSMTIYVKPFVRWVWLGAIFMCLGGVVAAGDKRYRRALEKHAVKKQAAAPAGSAESVEVAAR
jgi:cytochrome c-type biogenesis protein CcmF